MDEHGLTGDGFVAQCGCGKRYKVAAEKRGKRLKCKACGQTFVALPAPKSSGRSAGGAVQSTPQAGTSHLAAGHAPAAEPLLHAEPQLASEPPAAAGPVPPHRPPAVPAAVAKKPVPAPPVAEKHEPPPAATEEHEPVPAPADATEPKASAVTMPAAPIKPPPEHAPVAPQPEPQPAAAASMPHAEDLPVPTPAAIPASPAPLNAPAEPAAVEHTSAGSQQPTETARAARLEPAEAAAPAYRPRNVDIEHLDATPVDPGIALKGLSRGSVAAMVIMALVIHVIVIALTSVNHISLCLKYKTFWPKPVIKQEREDEEKRKLEAKQQAEQEKFLAEQQKAEAEKASKGQGKKETGEGKAEPKADAKDEDKTGKRKSKIERELEEKSSERPKEPTIRLDDVKTLD